MPLPVPKFKVGDRVTVKEIVYGEKDCRIQKYVGQMGTIMRIRGISISYNIPVYELSMPDDPKYPLAIFENELYPPADPSPQENVERLQGMEKVPDGPDPTPLPSQDVPDIDMLP